MQSNYKLFDFKASLERIDDILNSSTSYSEVDKIPKVENLTFKDGNYVKCAAFFIDLRGSTDLIKTQKKQPRTLARIYRAYISEIVAIVNSFKTCREVNIVGDCVSAIFAGEEDDSESPVIEALQAASMSNAMMSVLNVKFKNKWGEEFQEIKAGIGVALGKTLVIKAGFKGSKINDLIYMGDVVNMASKMCGLANKEYPGKDICVTESVYLAVGIFIANSDNLQTYQDFLKERNHDKYGKVFVGDFYRIYIRKWADEH